MAARTWLAVFLSILVWFVYMKWFAPPPPTRSEQPEVAKQESRPLGAPIPAKGSLFEKPLKTDSSYQAKNAKFEISFSDAGGRVSRVSLLGYRESIRKDSAHVRLVDPEQSTFSLAILFSDSDLSSFSDGEFVRRSEDKKVVFDRQSSGIEVIKEYSWSEDSYLVNTHLKIVFPQSNRRDWGHLVVPLGATSLHSNVDDPLKSWELVSFQNEKLTRNQPDGLKATEVLQGNTSWLAFGNRYFSSVLINASQINPDIVLFKEPSFMGGALRYPLQLKEGQNELELNLNFYLGAKNYSDLAKVPGLKQLIDYGMFSFFAFPLLELLKFFFQYVHNYGIAIILLTILVRILFYPLALKSYKSMKSMQKLQPQILALKEKYKDDRERFNREQLALFKAHKVNPAGGCLPMLVQLPVFIALYAVLGNSIELYHAPFFGWIRDLSSKDPYYVYPVLMGISMLIQQKMTPTVGMDPTQVKMMYLMPVVFTFIMLNLPSGLTVYIFISTLLGILQQYAMTKDVREQTAVVTQGAPEKG